jgi:hypothetical protein
VQADTHRKSAGRAQRRAQAALLARFKEILPPACAAEIDGVGRTERFEDNLLPGLNVGQIAWIRGQLGGGDGNELKSGRHRPKAHSAHSSAVLAANVFGRWHGEEASLRLLGRVGFKTMELEVQQRIFRGGRAPNLDAMLTADGTVVGIESKLTEHLARHRPRAWSDAYARESCRSLLDPEWRTVLDESMAGACPTQHLDVEQLIKHAIGLAKQHPQRERRLLYLFWEPTEGVDIEELDTHRKEVAALLDRVAGGAVQLHAMTHADLWARWEQHGPAWATEHVKQLRERYAVSIGKPTTLQTTAARKLAGP